MPRLPSYSVVGTLFLWANDYSNILYKVEPFQQERVMATSARQQAVICSLCRRSCTLASLLKRAARASVQAVQDYLLHSSVPLVPTCTASPGCHILTAIVSMLAKLKAAMLYTSCKLHPLLQCRRSNPDYPTLKW